VSYSRYVPLDDVSVRTVGTGRQEAREVTAYAAVYNTPAEIHDQDGHYIEELDPVVFNRAISHSAPAGSRKNWRVGVFYNHGMTILGTPSDRHSMPVGVPKDITSDSHGLLTVTTYHRSQFADEIVEGLESGAIPGYSFSGRFLRSNPMIPRGGFRPGQGGSLRTVRRMESTLREYGPTPFPAYAEAGITGIRSDTLLYTLLAGDPEMAKLLQHLRSAIRENDSTNDLDAPLPVDSSPKDSQPVEASRSSRLLKRQMNNSIEEFWRRVPKEQGNGDPA
jgi:phage head maturation protease